MIDPATVVLRRGAHATPAEGVNLVEAAALVAGEPMSDAPASVCPTLQRFARAWNDAIEADGERTRQLRPYVTALVGTAGGEAVAVRRARMALDWLVRIAAPAWLEVAGERDEADALRRLPAVHGDAPEVLDQLRRHGPERALDWEPERYAAWTSARRSLGDASWEAAWSAARYAPQDARWKAAADVVRAAGWRAAWPAVTAAGDPSGRRAQPVARLQRAVHLLVLGMIEAGPHRPDAVAMAHHAVALLPAAGPSA